MNTLLKFHLKHCFKLSIILILPMILFKNLKLENLFFTLNFMIILALFSYTKENYFFFIQNGCTRKSILSSLIKTSIIISLFFTLLEILINMLFIKVIGIAYINNIKPFLFLITNNISIAKIIIYIVVSFISYLTPTLLGIAAGLYKLKVSKPLFSITVVFYIISPIILNLLISLVYFSIGRQNNIADMIETLNYFNNNSIVFITIINTISCLIILAIIVFLNKRVRK